MTPVERSTAVLHLLKAGPKTELEIARAMKTLHYHAQYAIYALKRGGYQIKEIKKRGEATVFKLEAVPALAFPGEPLRHGVS
jgi:hypothetical protein